MLQIKIPQGESWDEQKQEFIYSKPVTLSLEHSLVSLSKWESRWKKSFLGTKDKTYEEVCDYIKCMTITQNVPDDVYLRLTSKNINDINNYINDPMTATYYHDDEKRSGAIANAPTAEIIYYWLFSNNIPMECQKWHLSKLLALLQVYEHKNRPEKKMSDNEIYARNRELNEARKKMLHTTG